jgi:hypothetical protein
MKGLNPTILGLTLTLLLPGAAFSQAVNNRQETNQQDPALQEGRTEKRTESKRPVAILSLLNEANAAPPEFTADLLIRLANSNKVQDPLWKREMLEDAYRLASKGEQKVKRDYAGSVMDTREGYLSLALALKLDVLSLQSRAVTSMLALDKQRAREMFSEIPPELKLPALTCADALVPDVADFYSAMKRIAQETFTADEIRAGAQVWFLQRYIAAMTSPTQVGPLVKVISAINLSQIQLTILLNSFSGALKRISSDYRAFTFAAFRDSLTRSFNELAAVADRKGVPKEELLQSLRAYLLRNFVSTQCADNTVTKKKEVPGFITLANQNALKSSPILLQDIQPLSIDGSVKTSAFWESSRSEDLLWKLKQLRFGADEKPRSDIEKASAEWHQQLTDYLNYLESWSASDEKSDLDYFHQKAIVYRVLSDILPPGMIRDQVWRSNAAFLANGYLQEARVEWFLHAGHLLDQVGTAKGRDRVDLIQILESSSNSILRAYAHYYQVVSD